MTGVAGLLTLLALLAWALRGWPRQSGRRLAPTWTCGMAPTSRFDYTATAFAKPLRLIFAEVERDRDGLAVPLPAPLPAEKVSQVIQRTLGRSLQLRHLDSGSCNA
jgi:hypothetical protein